MKIQSNSTAVSGQSFLRISEAACLAQVHQQTLRRAAENGVLKTYRLPSGHRRCLKNDVLAWVGVDLRQSKEQHNKLIIYARVSTGGQSRGFHRGGESDLTRQIQRLKAKALEDYHEQPDWNVLHRDPGVEEANDCVCKISALGE